MPLHNLTCKVAETFAERDAALRLRQAVFIHELQRDRPSETDSYDESACHIVAMKDSEVVGALRLYLLNPGDTDIKIGRVAVLADLRGRGIGAAMMQSAYDWALAQGYASCYLHAEVGVRSFYERLGYVAEGGEFMESGTKHVRMRRPCQA